MTSKTLRQERALRIPAEWSFSIKKLRAVWRLLAVSGSQNFVFLSFSRSALPPKADLELQISRRSASDPKRLSRRRNSFGQGATNSLCVDGLALLESVQLQP